MTTAQRTLAPIAGAESDGPDTKGVEEVLRSLSAAVRSYRLYDGSNPMVDRFVGAARDRFAALWDSLPHLRLEIEEHRIRWEGGTVFQATDSSSDLAFAFYKDGIRELTFLPGFEDHEILVFLSVLSRAPVVRQDQDDLITLLWQEDLETLRYRVVEPSDEGVDLSVATDTRSRPVDPVTVRTSLGDFEPVSTASFDESIFFLTDGEMRRLEEEVRKEAGRDVWRDVVNALLDRLEDGDAARQLRVVPILAELFPSALAAGEFDRGARMLGQIVSVAGQPGVLHPEALGEVRKLFERLGSEEMIEQFTSLVEEFPDRLADGSVPRLLAFFPPAALAPMMRIAEGVDRPSVRAALDDCVRRLAEANPDHLPSLLGSTDTVVLAGALVWIGKLRIGAGLGAAVRLLTHPDASVRVGAVEAIAGLGAASAGTSLATRLTDPDREVRIAAARALGALSFSPAAPAFEEVIGSRRLKDADRTEKLAIFENYGRICGASGVAMLEKILLSRGWIARSESPEIRACAALALAQIRSPDARRVLQTGAADRDPVVRAAVTRALRGEGAS
jgi:HEAT repeat protein